MHGRAEYLFRRGEKNSVKEFKVSHGVRDELLTYSIAAGEYLIIQLSGIETGIGLYCSSHIGLPIRHGVGRCDGLPNGQANPTKSLAHLYATAALAGPRSGITSVRRKPIFRHHPSKSRPVKSNASPNSISILSDIMRPKALLRRSSSIRFSIAAKAPPLGRASYAA